MNWETFFTLLACSTISTAIGYATAVLGRRFRRKSAAANDLAFAADQTQTQSARQMELLVSSLYELTSHVDSQVGQHSLRVNEITNTLEAPGEIGSALVLVAGKMLITANQKLQSDLEEAKKEIQRQREQVNYCMHESRTDALTGIANRRAFDIELNRVFAQRRRDGSPFSLLIVDIDYFKRVNDQYGHMVGDQLLKCFSRCLTSTFRESDFVARFGGEEFAAILPKTELDEAIKAAERVRNVISESRFKVGDLELQLTASIGVREVEDRETDAEVLKRADQALYAAKNAGRNRCFYHNGSNCVFIEPEFVEPPTDDQTPTGESVEDLAVAS